MNDMDRPRNVSIACLILGVCIVIGLIVGLVQAVNADVPPQAAQAGMSAAVIKTVAVFSAIIGAVIMGLFAFLSYLGKNWARIVYLVLFILGALLGLIGIGAVFQQSVLMGLWNIVETVAEIVALVLLFSGSSNAWFRNSALTREEEALPPHQ